MTESRLMKAWGQGCARSLVIRIIVAIFMLSAFLLITLATILLPIEQDIKIIIWVGLVIIFVLLVVAGVVGWGIMHIRKRASHLDKSFEPLGVNGRIYLINGRQYHGSYQGHSMHVYFSRGPLLEIFLEEKLHTRAGIGRKGKIERFAAELLNKSPLDLNDPSFEHLVVYPLDNKWTKSLVADPIAQNAIVHLMNESSDTEIRTLSITPGGLRFEIRYIPTSHITIDAVKTWVQDLHTLIRRATVLPQPTVRAEETKLEASNRTNRSRFTLPIIGITCSIFTILAICILAIVALLILLEETGL